MLSEDIEKVFLDGDRDQVVDPKTYDKMMYDIDFEKWMEAIKSKVDLIHSSEV